MRETPFIGGLGRAPKWIRSSVHCNQPVKFGWGLGIQGFCALGIQDIGGLPITESCFMRLDGVGARF